MIREIDVTKKPSQDQIKTIDECMNKDYKLKIVEDPDEGGFVAFYPELPGCITCGETLEEAVENALDAKRAWLEAALEDGFCRKAE